MQGFYSLEEAATVLGITPDELNRMAQRRELRAFADRGTWRFRTQDVDEMAQQRGQSAPTTEPPAGDAPTLAPEGNLPAADVPLMPDAPLLLDEPPAADAPPPPPPEDFPSPVMSGDSVFDEPLLPMGADDDIFSAPLDSLKASTALGNAGLRDDDSVMLGGEPGLGSSFSKPPSGNKPESSGRLVMEKGSFDFDLPPETPPAPTPESGKRTRSILPPNPEPAPAADPGQFELTPLGDDIGLAPVDLDETTSMPVLGGAPDAGIALAPDDGINLGSDGGRKSGVKTGSGSGRLAPEGGESDVRLDFDDSTAATLDDDLLDLPPPAAGDSDVRLSPLDEPPPAFADDVPALKTDEIDLDAELQRADAASQARLDAAPVRPDTAVKTRAVPPAAGTMLPDSSPFELSADDLDAPPAAGSVDQPMGSEFELTLAPEESVGAPLDLGADEGVDLGDLPPAAESPSGRRGELSGVNLHDPADSGLELDDLSAGSEEDVDDSVSFDLTLSDEEAGPKTIKGKLPAVDSDSEFELTLDDVGGPTSSPTLPPGGPIPGGEEKDIFETDFDLPALEDESASQAVALDEADTDLDSSDFDLAADDSSGSQAMTLDDSSGDSSMSSSSDADMSSVDEMLLDEQDSSYADLDADEDEEESATAAPSIPAAEAEWGLVPIFGLALTIIPMFIVGLMSYELLHGMWGYHAGAKTSGVVARSIAEMFTDPLPKE